ncbi:hypothetical protein CDAR_446691 [Caerostris darwini]|uniref:Uncharacterized protein n=1 Tax=Caerostris darwini TaxID=1538125 RepID=A0AAV4RHG4_9ARAC|nr:hypothetical protein CDAR_446691 [Caerostris darwini]
MQIAYDYTESFTAKSSPKSLGCFSSNRNPAIKRHLSKCRLLAESTDLKSTMKITASEMRNKKGNSAELQVMSKLRANLCVPNAIFKILGKVPSL